MSGDRRWPVAAGLALLSAASLALWIGAVLLVWVLVGGKL